MSARCRDRSTISTAGAYAEIRASHEWGKPFPEAPAADVLDRLGEMGPRDMRRAIMNGFGNAKLAGHDEIRLADIAENRGAKRQRIGF